MTGRTGSFALVGMSGAEKSMCIKGLGDLSQPDSGLIEIFSTPQTEPRARSRMAFLPERFLPPWYLSGRQFLRYMARLHGAAWCENRVREACSHQELDRAALARPA